MYFFERVPPRLSSALDCMRWIAAGLVVASHVRSMVLIDWPMVTATDRNPLVAAFYVSTSLGHQAVIVFFVLSGFLVGGSVVNDLRRQRFSLPIYLVNRISRLYVVLIPALILGWLCDAIGSAWFNPQGLYTNGWPTPLASLQFHVVERLSPLIALSNAGNLQTILTPTFGSNGPLWSLANEFWYYILFPLCLLPFIGQRSWSMRALLLTLPLLVGALIYPHILLYGGVWVLGVGVRFVPRALIPWQWASLIIALGAIVVCSRLPHWHESATEVADAILAVIIANLLLTLMHQPHSTDQLPGGRLHSALADFSYSLYLLHFPMLVLICATTQTCGGTGLSLIPTGVFPFVFMAVVVVVLYGYAWLVSCVSERHTSAVRSVLMRWCRLQPKAQAAPVVEKVGSPSVPGER